MFEKLKKVVKLYREVRDITDVDIAINDYLSGNMPRTVITEETSLSITAVWDCVGLISDSISCLPLHLYQRDKNNHRNRVREHNISSLLAEPNDYSSKYDLLQFLLVSVLLYGNGYLRIIRDNRFIPIRLELIRPYNCTPVLDNEGNIFYRIGSELVNNYEVIHIKGLGTDGVKGKSPIRVHAENLMLTHNVQDYGSKFFQKGGNVESVFTKPGSLSDAAYTRLKADLISKVSGLENAHVPLLLEEGMDYKRINIPLEDAQFLATRKFQKGDVASIYRVPPHMIGDLDRSTNNNIEQQGQEFITYCLMPYIAKIELEFNRKLLLESEKSSLYFKFLFTGLLRADAKSRSEYYKNLHLIGVYNANEIRELEELNPYEGGENYFVQSNMQTITKAITDNGE